MPGYADVTVVIRSVGERTEALCQHLLAQQIPEAQIFVIHEAPFTRALQCSYELGIREARAWTLVVDADILIAPNGLRDFMLAAQRTPQNVFKLHGDFVDKFFGGPRPVGMHLYRTALLAEGLKCIPASAVSIRPETHTIRQMAERGYPFMHLPVLIGLHDYEQSGHDIYRKAFVHAHKHRGYLPYLLHFWRREATVDLDYQIAVQGAQDGLHHVDNVEIDVRQFSESHFAQLRAEHGWIEKSALALEHPLFTHQSLTAGEPGGDVQTILQQFTPAPEYWAWRYLVNKSEGKTFVERVYKLTQHLGYAATMGWLFFHLFSRKRYSI